MNKRPVTIESIQSCPGWRGDIIYVGDTVWTPAGSSDPLDGKVIAILATSWPTVSTSPKFGCLIGFNFVNDQRTFVLKDADDCEIQHHDKKIGPMTAKNQPSVKSSSANTQAGWVILHPDGHFELDYFNSTLTWSKYDVAITPLDWMKLYRPDCHLYRVSIDLGPSCKWYDPPPMPPPMLNSPIDGLIGQTMVMAAHRYCLGRRDNVVGKFIEWLILWWPKLDCTTQNVIVRDTIEALQDRTAESRWKVLAEWAWEQLGDDAKTWCKHAVAHRNKPWPLSL